MRDKTSRQPNQRFSTTAVTCIHGGTFSSAVGRAASYQHGGITVEEDIRRDNISSQGYRPT
jgi:hypothetical protein